jgi:Uma2 family endonuclease
MDCKGLCCYDADMILEALTRPNVRRPVLETLQAHLDGAENGGVGEDRLVTSGVSWEGYLELDQALGHERPGPRLYYLDGELEIMTTSLLHERLKKWIGDLLGDYLMEIDREVFLHGQATMRILEEAGAEPDESWCFDEEKERPDLVLEIALTSGGIPKLDIYRRFSVPEVWIWRKDRLEIWTLRRGGYEGPAKKSRLLPGVDIAALTRCLELSSWREARHAFRRTLARQKRKSS